MMVYDLAIVEDHGHHYRVIGTTKNTLDRMAGEDYIKVSSMAYEMIWPALRDGKEVRLPKVLHTNEVLPGEVQIIEHSPDDADAARTAALIKVRSLVVPEMTKESGFTLYNFMMMNNELASEGYFITNNNREEKYIEIIETGNERLIETLEMYLEAKDTLDRAASMKVRLDKFRKEIGRMDAVDDIKTATDNFLATFYTSK